MEKHNNRSKWARIPVSMVAILVAVAIVVAAASVLFSQTAPSVSTSGPTISVGTCTTLSAHGSPVAGTPGFVTFDCAGTAAFTVNSAGPSVTPTFSLGGTGYTDVVAYLATGAPAGVGCSSATDIVSMTSGTGATFPATGGFSYCADYSSAPSGSLGAFTVSWSQ